MRRDSPWSVVFPLVLALAFASAMFVANEWAHQAARTSQDSMADHMRARTLTNALLRRLVDAETAQRGYLLTGRSDYLEPYRTAEADVLRGLAEVQQDYEGNPRTRVLYESLTRQSRAKLAELAATLAMYDAQDHLGWKAVLVTDQGRVTMDAVREAALKLVEIEERQVEVDRAVVFEVLDRGRLAVHLATALALIWFLFFLRKNRALVLAQAAHAHDLKQQRDALEQQVVVRTDELRELNAHLQDVREVERSKLARLLHDDLGSLLTAAKLDLARLRRALAQTPPDVFVRLEHLSTTIDDGVALKRRIIEDLSPSALHNLGLRAALEILVAEFRRRSGLPVALQVEEVTLGDSPRIAVYRLVQECLDNLERHAGASSATVVVRQAQDEVLVQVTDSGAGFDPARIAPSSHGLRKLRHRIEALGGRMHIVSTPGQGTEVEARLPLTAVPG